MSPVDPIPGIDPTSSILISNEGGFGFNNASVSVYQPDSQLVNHQLFQTNNSRPLGDVLQNIVLHQDQLYLVMNNSNKIEVVDPDDFSSISSIGSFTSPRYLLPVGNDKAYLTDLYEDAVYVVDLANESILKRIPLLGWTEELVQYQQKVFVSNRESKYVYVIDVNTDELIDSIATSYNSSHLVLDKNAHLWVYCSGDEASNQIAGLYVIDAASSTVVKSLPFDDFQVGAWPRLAINGSLDTIYCLKEDVYQLPIEANAFPNETFIDAEDRIFYALGVQANADRILVGDAIDYQQRGWILEYQSNGVLQHSFQAGVIPNGFYFY